MNNNHLDVVIGEYNNLKKLIKTDDLKSDEILNAIESVYDSSNNVLKEYNVVELKSSVPGKQYFSYAEDKKLSRAINKNLYETGLANVYTFFKALKNSSYDQIKAEDITSACYVIAISFCAIIDLFKVGDQKTPGTFFEYFIGHLFSRKLQINPQKKLKILNLDIENANLPTDYTFDLGPNKAKFHVPIKTSTRERVIQVWAHQRVLDGIYGVGRFLGTLVCLTETKRNKQKREVTEICLPHQWRLYQMFIAQLTRVYYLDMPKAYENLNKVFPKIVVQPFGVFFSEVDSLTE